MKYLSFDNRKIMVFEVIIIASIIAVLYNIVSLNKELYIFSEQRLQMIEAADRLRQSSDDLTHFARTYVVTGNKAFKDRYFKTLAIRNGEAPRPKNYNFIYWDLNKKDRLKTHPDTKKLALKDIFARLPFTKYELNLLKKSKQNSDDLVNMEVEAFNAMVGKYKDKNGNYTIKGKPNQQYAIQLLHSKAYYEAKARIMKPIDTFMIELEKRTKCKVEKIKHKIAMNFYIFLILLFIFIIGNFYIFKYLNGIIRKNREMNFEIKNLINTLDKNVITYEIDENGIITYVSEALCKISGYKKEELIGQPFVILKHPDISDELFDEIFKILKNAKLWEGEIKNIKKDGRFYWTHTIFSPKYNIDGEQHGYTAINYNITDTKELEKKQKQLMEQARLAQMGEMVSMIAHQWRQPLCAISAGCVNLKLQNELGVLNNEITAEVADKIEGYTQHLSKTIDDFMNFFKPDKEQNFTTANKLIDETLNILEASIKNHHIKIIKEINCDDEFKTHVNELKQVLMDIIKNAKDALVEKEITEPEIKIKSYKEDNFIVIEINDNAGGIPEDIIDKVFDPYFSTKGKNGTGIGLYMSKTIVEKHSDGELSVKNNKKGAVFTIKLPIRG